MVTRTALAAGTPLLSDGEPLMFAGELLLLGDVLAGLTAAWQLAVLPLLGLRL